MRGTKIQEKNDGDMRVSRSDREQRESERDVLVTEVRIGGSGITMFSMLAE